MESAESLVDRPNNVPENGEALPHVEPFPVVTNGNTIFDNRKKDRSAFADLIAGGVSFLPVLVGHESSVPDLRVLFIAMAMFQHIGRGRFRSNKESSRDDTGFSYTHVYYASDGARPEKGQPANALIIRMPRLHRDNVVGISSGADLEREMNYQIVKRIKEKLAVSPHIAWVLLDSRDFTTDAMPHGFRHVDDEVTYNSVLKPYQYEKNSVDAIEEDTLIPLTQEEFIDLTIDSADLLDQFVEAIDDEALTTLFERALMADPSERKHLHNELMILVTRLLNAELRFKLDTDPYLAEPNSDKALPRHTKLSQFITIRRADKGFHVVRSAPRIGDNRVTAMNSELQDLRGGIRAGKVEIQLDDLLRTSDTPVRDILAHDSPFKRAQLLYLCDSLLRTADLDDLFTIHQIYDQVREQMEAESIYTRSPQEIPVSPTITGLAKTFGRIYLGLQIYFGLSDYSENLRDHYEKLKNMPLQPISQESSSIPGELPAHIPIWKVETSDPALVLDGYWVEQTFDTFRPENASWISHAQSHEVDFPSVPPENYIKVTRPLLFHQATTIPVKQGTRLSAVRGRTSDGQSVDIITKVYTDGTVTAEFSGSLHPFQPTAVELEVYLEPTEQSDALPVKLNATSEKLNLADADSSIKDLYAEARMHTQQGHFEDIDQALAYLIQHRYTYGIDPESSELTDAQTPEDFVKKAHELSSMHCNTANTMLALMSQDTDRTYVTGYASAYTNKQDPQHGYLLASSGHGYTVNAEGIIRDATPVQPASPDSIQVGPDISEINNQWEKFESELLPKARISEEAREAGEKIAKYAGSAIALSLLARVALRLKHESAEARRRPEFQQALDDEFLSSFNSEEVIHAVDFLLHLSHQQEGVAYVPRRSDAIQNQDKPMSYLMRNYVIDKLRAYQLDPKSFEPEVWGKSQRSTSQALARYVLNVHNIG